MSGKPTVGRTVHFYSPSSAGLIGPLAAIITEVLDESRQMVALMVLHPNGFQVVPVAPFDASPTGGCWSWPPRV